jgi:hypothetical protein
MLTIMRHFFTLNLAFTCNEKNSGFFLSFAKTKGKQNQIGNFNLVPSINNLLHTTDSDKKKFNILVSMQSLMFSFCMASNFKGFQHQ